jgi:hypothetical protein
MRYFYRDPIVAAYMAKHYDMRFESFGCPRYPAYQLGVATPVDGPDTIVLSPDNATADAEVTFYIHPDSLHLLEPRHRDLMVGPNCRVAMFHMDGEERPSSRCRIVLRDGKPFFWPECEAA